jgi:hypothetical protein
MPWGRFRLFAGVILISCSASFAQSENPPSQDPDPERPTIHVQPSVLRWAAGVKPSKDAATRVVNDITFVDVLLAAGYDFAGGDYGNEPAITANPASPSEIVLTSFSGSNWGVGGNSTLFYSGDFGATWAYVATVPPPTGVGSSAGCPCDQTMDWGRDGRLFATFLHYNSTFTVASVYSAQTTSPTDPAAWTYDMAGASAQTTNLPAYIYSDQPWIWSGPTPGDPTSTTVSVAYDNFNAPYTLVEARAATSPGHAPIDFDRDAATNVDGQKFNDGMNAGNRLAVGPDGTIWNVYQRLVTDAGQVKLLQYLVTASFDGGQTFAIGNSNHASGARTVTGNVYSFQGNGSKIGGVNALLGGIDAITVDPNTGNAWIVYGSRGNTQFGIDRLFLVPVTKTGTSLTVGTARVISPTTTGSYLPSVAVLPNGEVAVLFINLSGTTFSWMLVQTADGGATLAKNTTLTSFTSPFTNSGASNQRIFGDYIQLRAVGCELYGTFPARGAGFNSVNSIDPYFLRAPAATACTPVALTALSPSAVCAGGSGFDLGLQGSGFVNGAVGRAGAALRSTSFGSPTAMTMTVQAGDIASPGSLPVSVLGAVPAGGLSEVVPLAVESPAGSPGASLVGEHSASDVKLDWSATAGATGYAVLRCASTAGACVPAPIAAPASNTYLDPVAGDAENYWYLVEATNSCGSVP